MDNGEEGGTDLLCTEVAGMVRDRSHSFIVRSNDPEATQGWYELKRMRGI